MLWFAPSVGSDAALIWGALGAGCYALGLVALGARMFLMLGVLARREGLKAVLALVVLAALCGHVAFAYSAPAPFYAFIAVAGLSLSGIAQLCFGLLGRPRRLPRRTGEKFLPRATPTSMETGGASSTSSFSRRCSCTVCSMWPIRRWNIWAMRRCPAG